MLFYVLYCNLYGRMGIQKVPITAYIPGGGDGGYHPLLRQVVKLLVKSVLNRLYHALLLAPEAEFQKLLRVVPGSMRNEIL